MNARTRIAMAIPALALLGPSCECVAGLDDDVRLGSASASGATTSSGGGGGAGSGSTASSGGGASGGGGGGPGCLPMDVPGYPGGDDAGGSTEVVVAVRSINLNDDVEMPTAGLNLDAACTCPGSTSCIPHDDTDDDLLCDADGGIDAQSGRIFAQLALLTNDQFSSRELSQSADSGSWSLLLRVEGWTGEPTDSKVRFSMFPSQGFPDGESPTWTGDDPWPVDSTSISEGGTIEEALYVDDNAFVADGILVASLPQTGIALTNGDSRLDLKLVAGFLKGRLVEEGGRWAMRDAVLAARLRTADLFDALDGFRDGSGDPICTTSPLFALARDTICESADIFSGTATPTSPCDSFSVGVGFSADPARLGPVETSPQIDPGCEQGTEPSRCTCDDGC